MSRDLSDEKESDRWRLAGRQFQAKVTASAKALRQEKKKKEGWSCQLGLSTEEMKSEVRLYGAQSNKSGFDCIMLLYLTWFCFPPDIAVWSYLSWHFAFGYLFYYYRELVLRSFFFFFAFNISCLYAFTFLTIHNLQKAKDYLLDFFIFPGEILCPNSQHRLLCYETYLLENRI